jgi:hypothetical protein
MTALATGIHIGKSAVVAGARPRKVNVLRNPRDVDVPTVSAFAD